VIFKNYHKWTLFLKLRYTFLIEVIENMRFSAFLLALCVFISFSASAQNSGSILPQSSTYIHSTKFFVSKPIRELPDYKPEKGITRQEAADKIRQAIRPSTGNFQPGNDYSDPVRQTGVGSSLGNGAPLVNFEGALDSIWDPADPNGAVSANYYVQLVNVTFTVYDKKGNIVLPTKDLGSFWSGDPTDGDPIVLYDKFADRWFISEFQITNSPYQLCVGVSQTNDPMGAYYVWEYSMGPIDPDYPKYSIWTDGYYITYQGLNVKNNQPIVPQQMAVLERNRMLKGDPNAGMIIANLPTPPDFQGGRNSLFAAPKTLDCDASALPPYGTPNYLVFFENKASGGYSNSIVMYKVATDTLAHTVAITRADSFLVPTFNAYFSDGSEKDISQPNYPNGVDALDGTFNFRVPYLRFTGYNSVVLSNTVNLGGSVAGIRWYELRQDEVTKVWSIYQDGTYAPNDGISRWNGAICMDQEGDIAMEYSVASSTVYPSIRYTGRLAGDALGQMTIAEQTVINGTATLSGTNHRWGDYSQLDIDPSDGVTFWGTNQYGGYSDNFTQLTRIFSFGFAPDLGIPSLQNKTELKAYQNGSILLVKASGLPDNDLLEVDLFDITGRQLTTQHVMPVANMFEAQINVATLPKGVYFIQVGKNNFQRVIKTEIN